MHSKPPTLPRERGFSLVEVLVVLGVVTVLGAGVFSLVSYSVRHSRLARDRQDARQAALERLRAAPPANPGGAVAPADPVPGYSDLVVAGLDGYDPIESPRDALSGPPIRRQWMIVVDTDGDRRFLVSAVVLDRDGAPLGGPSGTFATVQRMAGQ